MKNYLILILSFFFITFNISSAHVEHYKNIKLLKYDLYLNNKKIGSHTFEFNKKKNLFNVSGYGNFKVNKLGVVLMDYKTRSEEIYKNGQLIKYTSTTQQNDKNKFANIKIQNKKFIIDGSSFKGQTENNIPIGNWWNHQIVNNSKQISPISGSINKQKVTFLGKKELIMNGKNYKALHFHFMSDDAKPAKKKKINIQIWYDAQSLIWIKASYDKLGKWEYRLSSVQ